jgi:hypothetical protein
MPPENTIYDGNTGRELTAKERMRLWREKNPEAPRISPQPLKLTRKEMREFFNPLVPQAIDNLRAILNDPSHKYHAEVSLKVVEQGIGKPHQAVDGEENAIVKIETIRRVIIDTTGNSDTASLCTAVATKEI